MMKLQYLPIISVVIITVARLAEMKAKTRNTVAGKVRENLTLRLFVITGFVMLIGSIVEFVWRGMTPSWGWFIFGWVCAIFSIWLRWRAIAALGKFWSLHVEIRENHEFVQSGPFRWMRHPTYCSMVLELLSMGLILHAPYMLLIIPFIFVPILLMRLKLEEAALVGKFGDTYREYQRHTPALFPLKWPRSI